LNSSLLFIPDISGFTKFVNDTEVSHGRHVIAELLDLLIGADELGMTVSELEGDAVFFYRPGPLPDFETLLGQARRTFDAFHTHLKSYEEHRICDCGACSSAHTLSLKIVAHAGPIELISVRGFEKPYGPDVIVVHRLLKNDLNETEYLLATKAVTGQDGDRPAAPEWSRVGDGSASIEDLGDVEYHYVPLAPLRDLLPEPASPRVFPKMKRPIEYQVDIDRPAAEVFELVSNLDLRLMWNRGVNDIRYEKNRMNRVGTKHLCVIGGNLIEFETITDDFGKDRRVYGEHIPNNPLVDDFACYYIVTEEGGGSRVSFELHYRPKPFPRNFLAPLLRRRFAKIAPALLAALKEVAEAEEPALAASPRA
jgi:hypothetical protein